MGRMSFDDLPVYQLPRWWETWHFLIVNYFPEQKRAQFIRIPAIDLPERGLKYRPYRWVLFFLFWGIFRKGPDYDLRGETITIKNEDVLQKNDNTH